MNCLSSFTFHTDGNFSLLLLHSSPLPSSQRVLMGRWIKHSTVSFPGATSESFIDWFLFNRCKNIFFTCIFFTLA